MEVVPLTTTSYTRAAAAKPVTGDSHAPGGNACPNDERSRDMYIGGGVIALIVIILILVWLF